MTALVKALVDRGEDVIVLTSNIVNEGKVDSNIGVPIDFSGARLIYLPQQWMPPYGKLKGLEKYLDREAGDAEILHISSTLTRTSLQALRWAARNGKPYVVTTRGHLIQRNWRKDFKKRLAVKLALERYLRLALFLQVTSPLEEKALRHYGFSNIRLIPHGIEIPEDLPPRSTARATWKIEDDRIALVALGRLHPVKQIELILHSLDKLIRLGIKPMLFIAGSGDSNYLHNLKELVFQEKIEEYTQFVGHIEGAKKWSLLRAGDLFIHLSSGESFGVAIGEALGAGMPVLISENCGWDQAIELGYGQRVPRDLDSVVNSLNFLLADRSRLKDMGVGASNWVKNEFGWPRIANEMVQQYKMALQQKA